MATITHEWLDIETAPRDGTRILVMNDDYEQYRPRTAYWKTGAGSGVTGASGWKCALGHHWIHPTHWTPLPRKKS